MGRFKLENKIICNYGEYLEIDISSKTHPEAKMLIDRLDWVSLKTLGIGRVSAALQRNYLYAQCRFNGKMVTIHKLLIMDAKIVDHVSRDGLDNRRTNLRACSHSENGMNRRMNCNNSSGFKGVCFDKRVNKFVAQIRLNGKRKHLGYFQTASEASEVYKAASLKLHGEYSIYYNHNQIN
jgi:hypothetical protein